MVLEDLFLLLYVFTRPPIFLPVHKTTMVFTRPNDGWTGLMHKELTTGQYGWGLVDVLRSFCLRVLSPQYSTRWSSLSHESCRLHHVCPSSYCQTSPRLELSRRVRLLSIGDTFYLCDDDKSANYWRCYVIVLLWRHRVAHNAWFLVHISCSRRLPAAIVPDNTVCWSFVTMVTDR